MDDAEKFWLELLGHEFVGCARIMSAVRVLVGSPEMLGSKLFVRGDIGHILHLLMITETCSLTYLSSKPISVELKHLAPLKVPSWHRVFGVLAHVVKHTSKSALKNLQWNEIVKALDEQTFASGGSLRIGTSAAETFEILIPTRTASKAHIADPVILFNGNQCLQYHPKSNFQLQTISGRGSELECIFSHRFGGAVHDELPDIGLVPVVAPQPIVVVEKSIHYTQKPVNTWLATDLAHWIIDEFQKIYKIPAPWGTKELLNNLMVSGVAQLGRMQGSTQEIVMPRYKSYVEWLFANQKFKVTSSNLLSAKVMELYIVDKAQHKQTESINAFNQK
jgi:hypothetical protein